MPSADFDPRPFFDWINERHAIYLRKALLERTPPPSWADPVKATGVRDPISLEYLSHDPILRQYRFCNVFRELDRVTVWVDEHIRKPFADDPTLPVMLAAARTINWPPTLAMLIGGVWTWPDPEAFKPTAMGAAMDLWQQTGNKVTTGAYMIRAESNPKAPWYSWTKNRYLAEIVIGRVWERREELRTLLSPTQVPRYQCTVEKAWTWFQDKYFIGWGPFMAFQVVVDLSHTRFLANAPDRNTWAAVGPGSRRGLNRLHGRPVDHPLRQDEALAEMCELLRISPGHLGPHVPPLGLEDVQNSLCETDKYLRVKLGEGRPRATYIRGRGY